MKWKREREREKECRFFSLLDAAVTFVTTLPLSLISSPAFIFYTCDLIKHKETTIVDTYSTAHKTMNRVIFITCYLRE